MDAVRPLDPMATAEKLCAVEMLWADLSRKADSFDFPAWPADVLREWDQRIAEGKEPSTDWEVAKRWLPACAIGAPCRGGVRPIPPFARSANGLLSEADVLDWEMLLAVHPDAGDVIPGGRGLRKLRRPAKGRGKRGGARVIYYYVNSQSLILLIATYAKNEQEDLDRRQMQTLANLIKSEFP